MEHTFLDCTVTTAFYLKNISWFNHENVDALVQNIDERFKESSPVLDSFRIFDVVSVPAKTDDGFRYYLLLLLLLLMTI